jgi:hypothetical protein
MFDDLIRELKRLEQPTAVSIQLALDEDGYLGRACSHPECGAAFKVEFSDWRDKVADEAVHCPICGFVAEATDWNTPEQAEQIRSVALRHVHGQLNDAMARGLRRQKPTRHGFMTVSWSYKPGSTPAIVTAEASDVMTQKSTCEVCGCRYASVGAAFFCPACGHNSAISTFRGAVDTVRATLAKVDEIKGVLVRDAGRDVAEDSVRHICENSLVKLVAAFQRFAEAHYDALPVEAKPVSRRNLFQNLHESSEAWKAVVGWSYEDLIGTRSLARLQVYFQQRHALSHNDGIVDELYLQRSGDPTYALGQRLVVRAGAVDDAAGIVSSLADAMATRLGDA